MIQIALSRSGAGAEPEVPSTPIVHQFASWQATVDHWMKNGCAIHQTEVCSCSYEFPCTACAAAVRVVGQDMLPVIEEGGLCDPCANGALLDTDPVPVELAVVLLSEEGSV